MTSELYIIKKLRAIRMLITPLTQQLNILKKLMWVPGMGLVKEKENSS